MSSSKLTAAQKTAIIKRANQALVTEHADLRNGVAEIGRLRGAAERGEPGSLILLTGDSGAGKTTILRHYLREERARLRDECGREAGISKNGLVFGDGPNGDERPAVFVNLPSSRSLTAFAASILLSYGAEVPTTLRKHQILDRVRAQILGQKTQVLILDEFHHAVRKDSDKVVWELSEHVKDILVETRVQIVLSGMPEAILPVDANDQLDRRCRLRIGLEPFEWGEEPEEQASFLEFLRDLEEAMDLPRKSDLSDPTRASRIYRATGGLLGRVTRLLQLAAEEGVEQGTMCITDPLMGWVYDRTKRIGDASNPFADAGESKGKGTRRRQTVRSNDLVKPTRLRGTDDGRPARPTYTKRK